MTLAKEDICQTTCVHEQSVAQVNKQMLSDQVMQNLADLFKILGDFTRVRIVHALSCAELCVCDLSVILGMSASAISHQLRILRTSKLIKFRRQGKNIFYSLDDEHVQKLLQPAIEHVQEDKIKG